MNTNLSSSSVLLKVYREEEEQEEYVDGERLDGKHTDWIERLLQDEDKTQKQNQRTVKHIDSMKRKDKKKYNLDDVDDDDDDDNVDDIDVGNNGDGDGDDDVDDDEKKGLESLHDADETNQTLTLISQLVSHWNDYLYHQYCSAQRKEKQKKLFLFLKCLSDAFYNQNPEIHYLLSHYLNIYEIFNRLSLELVNILLDILESKPNDNLNQHLTSINTDRMRYYFGTSKDYSEKIGILLITVLCLLTEVLSSFSPTDIDIVPVQGFTTCIVLLLKIIYSWFSLNETSPSNFPEIDAIYIENDVSVLRRVYQQIEHLVTALKFSSIIPTVTTHRSEQNVHSNKVSILDPINHNNQYKENGGDLEKTSYIQTTCTYAIEENITIKDRNPCILLAILLKNISQWSQCFEELFLPYKAFDKIASERNLANSRKADIEMKMNKETLWLQLITLITKAGEQTSQSNWGIFVQFTNLISLAFGNFFQSISQVGGVNQIHELNQQAVLSDMIQHIEVHFKKLESSVDQNITPTSCSLQLYRLSLLFITEICIFSLFSSLQVVPSVFMAFYHKEGYQLFEKLFIHVNTIEIPGRQNILHVYEQQKMLSVLRIMLCLVVDLTRFIQRVKYEEGCRLCYHNEHVFEVIVRLFDKTSMDISNTHQYFCCKYELLNMVTQILILHPEEYNQRFHVHQPFHYLQKHFCQVSPPMQMEILYCFERYIYIYPKKFGLNPNKIKLSTDNDSTSLELLKRDIKEYGLLLLKHLQCPQSVIRVCHHTKTILDPSKVSHDMLQALKDIQKLFRLSGFTEILLKGLEQGGPTDIMSELLEILYLYLLDHIDNHVDLVEFKFQKVLNSLEVHTPKSSLHILYFLLYDKHLINLTLRVIKMIVISDKDQKWHHIIADLIEILSLEVNYFLIGSHSNQEVRLTLEMSDAIVMSLREMVSNNISTKNSIRNCRGLECLVNLLNRLVIEAGSQNKDLVFKVMQSLILLLNKCLVNNMKNQQYFRQKIRFVTLLVPLHNLGYIKHSYDHGIDLCMNLFQLALMTESLFTDLQKVTCEQFEQKIKSPSNIYLFNNPEVLCDVMLKLIGHNLKSMDRKIALFFFNTLYLLTSRFSVNRQRLCSISGVERLLKEFTVVLLDSNHFLQQTILDQFLMLALQDFPIKDMHYFFSMFKQVALTNRSGNDPPDNIIECVLHLAKKEKFVPTSYIDFLPLPQQRTPTGSEYKKIYPSIQFPRLNFSPWPHAKGYSVTLWFRVEHIDSARNQICLFSFLAQNNDLSVDGIITQHSQFAVRIAHPKPYEKKTSKNMVTTLIEFESFTFKKNKWYFISLGHQQSVQRPKTIHTLCLYVNGSFCDVKKYEYEDNSFLGIVKNMFNMSTYVLEYVRFGNQLLSETGNEESVNDPTEDKFSSFQLGNAFFLEGMLNNIENYMIYHLGPNYIGYFDDDFSQFFTNEIINEKSVHDFPQKIYYMKDCSNNFTLKHLVDRVIIVFSARDATISTRLSIHLMSSLAFSTDHSIQSSGDQIMTASSYIPTDSGDALMISKSISEFTPVRTTFLGNGNVEYVNRYTFKSNLFSIGGMSTILGLMSVVEKLSHKNIILQTLSYLMRYNMQNSQEMLLIDGYDMLNYNLTQQVFLISDAVLDSILIMAGLNLPNVRKRQTISSPPLQKNNTAYDQFALNVSDVLSNNLVLEKLLLDYQIWKSAPLRTQRNLFETLAYLVSDSNIHRKHHINVYQMGGVIKKLFQMLSECHILGIQWPNELIRPLINILRSVIPQPLTTSSISYLYQISKYVIMTHPERGIRPSSLNLNSDRDTVIHSEASLQEPEKQSSGINLPSLKTNQLEPPDSLEVRKAVLQFLLGVMRECSDDVLDELTQFLPTNQLLAMLDNPNSATRAIILKIIGLYLLRIESARTDFRNRDKVHLIEYFMKDCDPSFFEFQVLFDLLIGQFYAFEKDISKFSEASDQASSTNQSFKVFLSSSISIDNFVGDPNRVNSPITPSTISNSSSSIDFRVNNQKAPKYNQSDDEFFSLYDNNQLLDEEIEEDGFDGHESSRISTSVHHTTPSNDAKVDKDEENLWSTSLFVESSSYDSSIEKNVVEKKIPTRRRKMSEINTKRTENRRSSVKRNENSRSVYTKDAFLQNQLIVSSTESFMFPEFLYAIFSLIPLVKHTKRRYNVLYTLLKIFISSGYNVKQSFVRNNAHKLLLKHLQLHVVKNDDEFMILVCDFLVEYMCFAIHLKDGIEILSDILGSFFLLKGYSTVFVQEFQRYILHGILLHFQRDFLYVSPPIRRKYAIPTDEKKYTEVEWDLQFSRFCACAVDHVLQWFTLPQIPPSLSKAAKIASETSKDIDNDDDDDDDDLSLLSMNRRRSDSRSDSKDGLILTAQEWFGMEKFECNQMKIYDQAKNKTKSELYQAFISAESSRDNRTTYEEKRIIDTKNTPKQTNVLNASAPEKNRKVEEIDFRIAPEEIRGFVYWLVEAMRMCLLDMRGKKGQKKFKMRPQFILKEQVKRLFLHLVDVKCTITDNVFSLLNLLYFFPDKKDSEHSNDTKNSSAYSRNQSDSKNEYNMVSEKASEKSTNIKEAAHWSIFLEEFANDSYFIIRILYLTSKLFVRASQLQRDSIPSLMLTHLTRKNWNMILRNGKGYLKNLFVIKKVNPMHPEFVSMIEEAADVLGENQFNSHILQPEVEENVRGWEDKNYTELQTKITKRVKSIHAKYEADIKANAKVKMQAKTEMNNFIKLQHNNLKPVYIEIQKIDERDFYANKKWRNLLKQLCDERSVLNVYEFHLCKKEGGLNDSSVDEMQKKLIKYNENTYFNIKWRLDPTAGPCRVRIRLKKHKALKLKSSDILTRSRRSKSIKEDKASIEHTIATTTTTNTTTTTTATTTTITTSTESSNPSDTMAKNESSNTKNSMNEIDNDQFRVVSNEINAMQKANTTDQIAEAYSQLSNIVRSTNGQYEEQDHISESLLEQPSEEYNSPFGENPSPYVQINQGEMLFVKTCTRITPLRKYEGEVVLVRTHLYFFGWEQSHDGQSGIFEDSNRKQTVMRNSLQKETRRKYFSISYEMIREIHNRRYLLRNCAIELFFMNGKSLFLAFSNTNDREEVYKKLTEFNLPNYIPYESEFYGNMFKKSVTQKWQEGLISNFEYLMHLNMMAGRSFNDLTQYPVFPFILANYNSESFPDLKDPRNYRDLTKPMGALNEKRLAKAQESYKSLVESHEIPRHWGTHYSTPMSVAFYLIRLEPFTRFFWELNSKSLDLPDRTFHSLQMAWNLSSGQTHSMSDVKELIPEFFYLPEFLKNRNDINFGQKQSGEIVNEVELPPWCKGNPIRFVRMHRKALESDYVSKNLHHWIDLIFGYKQNGEEGIKAANIFNHLTYEGCMDEMDTTDDITWEANWTQILNYGQTPKQLFDKYPHVERKQFSSHIYGQQNLININPQQFKHINVRLFKEAVGDLFILDDEKTVIAVGRNKVFIPPLHTEFNQFNVIPSFKKRNISNAVFLSYNHWDKTLRICKWETGKTLFNCKWIRPETYSCATFSQDGKILAVGSDACVVHVFKMNDFISGNASLTSNSVQQRRKLARKSSSSTESLSTAHRYIEEHLVTLSGHSKRVISVCLSTLFSIIVSGSEDKTMIIWDLHRMTYIRSIHHEGPVSVVAIGYTMGDIASFCVNKKTKQNLLYLRTMNGDLIGKCELESKATCMAFSWAPEGVVRNIIAVGMQNGSVAILDSLELSHLTILRVSLPNIMPQFFVDLGKKSSKYKKMKPSPITAIAISPSMQELVTADDRGMVISWAYSQNSKSTHT